MVAAIVPEWLLVAAILGGLVVLAILWWLHRRNTPTVCHLRQANALEAAVLALTESDPATAYWGGDYVDIEAAHVVEIVDRFDLEEKAAITKALEKELAAGTTASPDAGPMPLRPATRIDLLTNAVGARVRLVSDKPTHEERLRGERQPPAPTHLLVVLARPTVQRWMADAVEGLAATCEDPQAAEAVTRAGKAAVRHFRSGDHLEAVARLSQMATDATAGALSMIATATPASTEVSVVRVISVQGDPDRLVFPARFPALMGEAIRSVRAQM